MSRFSAPIAEQIWDMKYRLKTADDEPIDACVEESWRRVAKDLARVEAEPGIWEEKFYAALEDFKFLPAGPDCRWRRDAAQSHAVQLLCDGHGAR